MRTNPPTSSIFRRAFEARPQAPLEAPGDPDAGSPLRATHAIPPGIREWDKTDHLGCLQASGRLRYVQEGLLHHTEPCPAERWVGFALTPREVTPVLELGLDEATLALERFRQAAGHALGPDGLCWHVSYRVRVGVT
jgi:hypothetical protein